jgi:plasmid maintenance system antidote protein VapI
MKNYTESQVLDSLREMVSKGTQRQTAAQLGFTPQYINDVLSNRRTLSSELAFRIGYVKLPNSYVRKEG